MTIQPTATRSRPVWYEAERQRILARLSEIEYEMQQRMMLHDERLSLLDYGDPVAYIRRYGPIEGAVDGEERSR